MEYACREGSDQYDRLPSLFGVASAESDYIGFLKTMGFLNQTKCFMMMIGSFMDLGVTCFT